MPKPIRTFIAVKIALPHAIGSVLEALDDMRGSVKTVASDQSHVTLKFLGDIDPRTVGDVGNVVQSIAARRQAFDLRIVGLGAFPSLQHPSVVWAGLKNAEPLIEIAAELDAALEPLGLPRE